MRRLAMPLLLFLPFSLLLIPSGKPRPTDLQRSEPDASTERARGRVTHLPFRLPLVGQEP